MLGVVCLSILDCELQKLVPKQVSVGVFFWLGIEMRNWELKQVELNPSTHPWLALFIPWSKNKTKQKKNKKNKPNPHPEILQTPYPEFRIVLFVPLVGLPVLKLPSLIFFWVLPLFLRRYGLVFCTSWSLQRPHGFVSRCTVWLSSKWKKIRTCTVEARDY